MRPERLLDVYRQTLLTLSKKSTPPPPRHPRQPYLAKSSLYESDNHFCGCIAVVKQTALSLCSYF